MAVKPSGIPLTLEAIDTFMDSDWAVLHSELVKMPNNQQVMVLISRALTDLGALSYAMLQKYDYTDILIHSMTDEDINKFMASIFMNLRQLSKLMGRSWSDVFYSEMKDIQQKLRDKTSTVNDGESADLVYSAVK
ncbi:MAG: hypothetical protein FWD15_02615 [Alphaproteobacteria bacterium]|nr:hypothetical protein [Alphaproteobacteria bacterium]